MDVVVVVVVNELTVTLQNRWETATTISHDEGDGTVVVFDSW